MKTIPYLFCDPMAYLGPTGTASPSAMKPALVTQALAHRELIKDVSYVDYYGEHPLRPLDGEELCLAHDAEYVYDVLSGAKANGFGSKDAKLTKVQQYTTAAMVRMAKEAMKKNTITCAPVSGFHHAHFAQGSGFCTFNGLILAAIMSGADRVGIIDCDYHYGDGTQDIIDELRLHTTIFHWSAGKRFTAPVQAEAFLTEVAAQVLKMTAAGAQLIIYQAGGDQHIDDPLGGFLTTAQMAARDALVFDWAHNISGLPVVFNFAGGYQDPVDKVVALHVQTVLVAHDILNGGSAAAYLKALHDQE